MSRLLGGLLVVAMIVLACSSSKIPSEHRPTAPVCAPGPAQPEPDSSECGGECAGACATNEGCAAGKNGVCFDSIVFGTHCYYDECTTDADCTTGMLCDCADAAHGSRNTCVQSNCRVDADCGAGYCSPSVNCGLVGYFCHQASDVCIEGAVNCDNGSCVFDLTKQAWACEDVNCPS